jgi:hypothetical protein
MTEATRTLYAKFKKSESSGLFSSFVISEQKEKIDQWPQETGPTGASEEDPSGAVLEKIVDSEEGADDELGFASLTAEFLASMNVYYRIIPATMSILPVLERYETHKSVYELVASRGRIIEKKGVFESYELDIDHVHLIDESFERMKALSVGQKNLPGMFLMGLVSSYDAFLGRLLRLMFLTRPELLSASDRIISFGELVELGSVEAARELVIEKEIESILRTSHVAQFEWLESRLKITLRKDLEVWPDFVELCERRNLFTHASGLVSTQYISVCQSHGCSVDGLKAGAQLKIDGKYLRNAIFVVSQLGLKLIQVIWRKPLPEKIRDAENSLNRVGYELITRKRYRLADAMLDFGIHTMKKFGEDATRKMMVVNYANVKKLRGKKDESEKILSEEDWSAVNDSFRICVAAVRDDVSSVVKLMESVVNTDQLTKSDFRSWPVFNGIRENPQFVSEFERIFSEPFFLDKVSIDNKADASEASETGLANSTDEVPTDISSTAGSQSEETTA